MASDITVNGLTQIFKEKLIEVQEEPEFQRSAEKIKCATDEKGEPLVKLAVGNVPLNYDLWKGLRNPAVVGLYPAGLPEIWEFYANRRKQKVDEAGRQTIFQVPRSFDFALRNYRRAVIISVMLPHSPQIVQDYVNQVIEKKKGSSHLFARMHEDVSQMLDKISTRTAIDLVTDDSDRVVVAMNSDTANAISAEAIPQTHQGVSHGPSKGGNYAQKSVAALIGLGQFGISRIIFRDELTNGKVKRFSGPIRSIIIFDKHELIRDGSDSIFYPSQAWRGFLAQLFDFTNTDRDINQYRFCSYIPLNDKGCPKCINCCPSGAQPNSIPNPDGQYSEQVARQAHRFWDGKLQFDYGKCCDDRGQMSGLLPEWSCARCLSICVDQGIRRKYAAQNFYQKMYELMEEPETALIPA
ncbi:hypothetical protein ACFLSK_03045 [Chloroflexota bacterium]